MFSAIHYPSISVIIPNRNDAVYLGTCLNSILRQSVRPNQIIFVDDHSSDNSVSEAQSLLNNFCDARIIVNPKCIGTIGAINEGLKIATGDYVLFLASNDFVLDGLFERARCSISETGYPGVWSAMVWTASANGTPRYLYPSSVVRLDGGYIPPAECIRLANRTASWFMGTTLFFERAALVGIGGLDINYQGLADLLAALTISSIFGATFLAEPLGVMRVHADGFLFRTISNLENLEQILLQIETKGPNLSPQLYTSEFCRRMKDRFRFAAVRALGDISKSQWPGSWKGLRYSLFRRILPLINKQRILKTIAAMLLLRPFDVVPMIWYRLMGPLWLMVRRRQITQIQVALRKNSIASN
jgi:glycosyltransferase involved in cell wall biosynthesis